MHGVKCSPRNPTIKKLATDYHWELRRARSCQTVKMASISPWMPFSTRVDGRQLTRRRRRVRAMAGRWVASARDRSAWRGLSHENSQSASQPLRLAARRWLASIGQRGCRASDRGGAAVWAIEARGAVHGGAVVFTERFGFHPLAAHRACRDVLDPTVRPLRSASVRARRGPACRRGCRARRT